MNFFDAQDQARRTSRRLVVAYVLATILIVLGVYLAVTVRDRPWLAALGVALAFIKPQFGLPLTALLMVTGSARVAWRGLVITAATAAPVLVRLVVIEEGLGGVMDAVRENLRFAEGYAEVPECD